jgi:retinol-binding protein 3
VDAFKEDRFVPLSQRVAALIGLVLLSVAAQATQPPQPLDAVARKDIVDALVATLANDYVFVDTGARLARAVKASFAAGAYDAIESADEFARALCGDMAAIAHDKHLRVNYHSDSVADRPEASSPADMRQDMLNGAITRLEILPGNIGYLQSNAVPPLKSAQGAVAAAFAFLHRTDALIIDARANLGGDPHTVALYLSYLSEGPPYLVNTFHRRQDNQVVESMTMDVGPLSYGKQKPVFVLTSHRTFSGGEELAYDIQAFKRGKIVGENTGGGANLGRVMLLGHQFSAFIPTGYPSNPVTGGNWERVGVKPDVAVPANQALITAERLALDRLGTSARDPGTRAMLKSLASKLVVAAPAVSGVEPEGEANRCGSTQ